MFCEIKLKWIDLFWEGCCFVCACVYVCMCVSSLLYLKDWTTVILGIFVASYIFTGVCVVFLIFIGYMYWCSKYVNVCPRGVIAAQRIYLIVALHIFNTYIYVDIETPIVTQIHIKHNHKLASHFCTDPARNKKIVKNSTALNSITYLFPAIVMLLLRCVGVLGADCL